MDDEKAAQDSDELMKNRKLAENEARISAEIDRIRFLGPMGMGVPGGMPSPISISIRRASNGFILSDDNRFPRREIIAADEEAVLDILRQELPKLT